jgi:hypothetical protein
MRKPPPDRVSPAWIRDSATGPDKQSWALFWLSSELSKRKVWHEIVVDSLGTHLDAGGIKVSVSKPGTRRRFEVVFPEYNAVFAMTEKATEKLAETMLSALNQNNEWYRQLTVCSK